MPLHTVSSATAQQRQVIYPRASQFFSFCSVYIRTSSPFLTCTHLSSAHFPCPTWTALYFCCISTVATHDAPYTRVFMSSVQAPFASMEKKEVFLSLSFSIIFNMYSITSYVFFENIQTLSVRRRCDTLI